MTLFLHLCHGLVDHLDLVVLYFLPMSLVFWLLVFWLVPAIRTRRSPEERPFTVVIPVRNEAGRIGEALARVFANHHKPQKILVIDDGSTDGTAEILESFGDRIALLRRPATPSRKAHAINAALPLVTTPFCVVVDGDTFIAPDTFEKILDGFQNERVAAVSALVRPDNLGNLLTHVQAIDYAVGMLLRLAQDRLGATPTLIGVCMGVRTDVLRRLGGMPTDTLIEDGDLTALLVKQGHRVKLVAHAVTTDAPVTFGGLVRQRRRWSQGRIQVMVKHLSMCFRPRHGWFGLLTFPFEGLAVVLSCLGLPVALYHLARTWAPHWVHVGLPPVSTGHVELWLGAMTLVVFTVFMMLGLGISRARLRWWYFLLTLVSPLYFLLLTWALFQALMAEGVERIRQQPASWDR